MKKLSIILIVIASTVCFTSSAQKVATVTITSKTTLDDAFAKCKEAGKKAGYGSRDMQVNESDGKFTLWQGTGTFVKTEMAIELTATYKDGVTTMIFRMPHNPKIMANYPHEIKRVTSKLKLPDMLVGKYFDGIE